MKRIITLLAVISLTLHVSACSDPIAVPAPTFQEELSAFLSTRADEPLNGTIWEHRTGEEYNRYLWFDSGTVRLFYGCEEDGGLHRYTDFWSAPYALVDGQLFTSLSYPLWGHTERNEMAEVIRSAGVFTLEVRGESYHYYGNDTQEIQDLWMVIFAHPVPWE